MPFQIIRNDITKVKADAIVNTANPEPKYAAGTDGAIYKAAGADKLLAERKKIGRIKCGDVAVTPAFNLKAKYIIHTVAPAWNGGNKGEFEALKSCYSRSLTKAAELGCESIAFPLIATGVYMFPKDKGWEYEPEREEIADKALNDRLQDIQSIVIEYGGYFGGTEKRTITFEGEKILVEKEYMLRIPSPEELQEDSVDESRGMDKAEFLEALADFHLGEWEKEYEDLNVLDGTQWSVVIKFSSGKAFKSNGSNRFPYNFNGFLDLVGISESDM